jgi:hypothetical protein
MAAESRYRVRSCALIARHRLTPLFRIELSCNRGGANQIAEQHRQMAPLARRAALAWFSFRVNRRGSIEWCGALCAEPGFGGVRGTALRASALKRRCALNAELRALGIFR